MFANWLIGYSKSHVRLAVTEMRKSCLEVVAAGGIILFNRFRENNKRIANEEMRNVFG